MEDAAYDYLAVVHTYFHVKDKVNQLRTMLAQSCSLYPQNPEILFAEGGPT